MAVLLQDGTSLLLQDGTELLLQADGGGDPYWANVWTLCDMLGTDGDLTCSDTGENGPVLGQPTTISGNFAQLSNTYGSPFSPSETALRVVGSSGTCDLQVDTWSGIGTQDFAFEWHQYKTVASGAGETIFGNTFGGAGFGFFIYWFNGVFYVTEYTAGQKNFGITLSGGEPALNTWHHCALVRSGNTMTLYVNGVSEGSVDCSTMSLANQSSYAVAIGDTPGLIYVFNGYLANVRVTVGVPRYTADFTPPTEAYPVGSGAPPGTPLAITTEPLSASVAEGAVAQFSVVAGGGTGPYTYQWYNAVGDVALVEGVTGDNVTTDTVSVTTTLGDDGNTYYVIITDSA